VPLSELYHEVASLVSLDGDKAGAECLISKPACLCFMESTVWRLRQIAKGGRTATSQASLPLRFSKYVPRCKIGTERSVVRRYLRTSTQNRAASTWKPLLPLSELSPPRNGGCKATRPAFFGDLVRRLDVHTTSTYEAQEFRRGMALSPFMTLGGTRLIQRLTSRSTDRTRRGE